MKTTTPATPVRNLKRNLFLPDGSPKYIRAYDNGGPDATRPGSIDRYTVVYTGNYRGKRPDQGWYQYVGMSSNPFHPQGVGIHSESQTQIDVNKSGFAPAIGRRNHLGLRIHFNDLPNDCKKLVLQDYAEIWNTFIPDRVATVLL